MADFRSVHCKMWRDDWFLSLDSDGKTLWVYLITGPASSCSGLYELPPRYIPFETGIPQEKIGTLLAEFESSGKLMYQDGVIWIRNMREYQVSKSPKLQTFADKDAEQVKDGVVKTAYFANRAESTPSDGDPLAGYEACAQVYEAKGGTIPDTMACQLLWKKLVQSGNIPPAGHLEGLPNLPSTFKAYLELKGW